MAAVVPVWCLRCERTCGFLQTHGTRCCTPHLEFVLQVFSNLCDSRVPAAQQQEVGTPQAPILHSQVLGTGRWGGPTAGQACHRAVDGALSRESRMQHLNREWIAELACSSTLTVTAALQSGP